MAPIRGFDIIRERLKRDTRAAKSAVAIDFGLVSAAGVAVIAALRGSAAGYEGFKYGETAYYNSYI